MNKNASLFLPLFHQLKLINLCIAALIMSAYGSALADDRQNSIYLNIGLLSSKRQFSRTSEDTYLRDITSDEITHTVDESGGNSTFVLTGETSLQIEIFLTRLKVGFRVKPQFWESTYGDTLTIAYFNERVEVGANILASASYNNRNAGTYRGDTKSFAIGPYFKSRFLCEDSNYIELELGAGYGTNNNGNKEDRSQRTYSFLETRYNIELNEKTDYYLGLSVKYGNQRGGPLTGSGKVMTRLRKEENLDFSAEFFGLRMKL